MPLAPVHQFSREADQFRIPLDKTPVIPGNAVILAIWIVVTQLRPSELIAAQWHGNATGQGERRKQIPDLTSSQLLSLDVAGFAFEAVVGATVLVHPVAVVCAVHGVVLVGVAPAHLAHQPRSLALKR
jgi:hypothetical protein